MAEKKSLVKTLMEKVKKQRAYVAKASILKSEVKPRKKSR